MLSSFAVLIAGSSLLASGCFAPPQSAADPQAAAIQDFQNRIDVYLRMTKEMSKGLSAPKPTNEPRVILERQRELARKIHEARSQAHQGDIFTPAIAKEFRRLLTLAMAGPNRADIRQSLAHAEPVTLTLKVNEAYPPNIPLQSTPASILMNLPRLPPELEYRIAGHALVLRDATANIVVDLIPDAI